MRPAGSAASCSLVPPVRAKCQVSNISPRFGRSHGVTMRWRGGKIGDGAFGQELERQRHAVRAGPCASGPRQSMNCLLGHVAAAEVREIDGLRLERIGGAIAVVLA